MGARSIRKEPRNVPEGRIRIVEVVEGATTAHVKLDLGGSTTASITDEAVDQPGLKKG